MIILVKCTPCKVVDTVHRHAHACKLVVYVHLGLLWVRVFLNGGQGIHLCWYLIGVRILSGKHPEVYIGIDPHHGEGRHLRLAINGGQLEARAEVR